VGLTFVLFRVDLAGRVKHPIAFRGDDRAAYALKSRQIVEGDIALLRGIGGSSGKNGQSEGRAQDQAKKGFQGSTLHGQKIIILCRFGKNENGAGFMTMKK
jgi:hypothetical protein